MNKKSLTVALLASAVLANQASAQILPDNNLALFDSENLVLGIDQATFNSVIDRVTAIYKTAVESHGGKLVVERLWDDPTVNARAGQTGLDSNWTVYMYGGLARRAEMTADGFALVICHELGHHLGGFPFKDDSGSHGWAASEGQADYWGSQECLRKVFKNDLEENAKAATTVVPFAKKQCDRTYTDQRDRNLCYRSTNAAIPLAQLLAALGNETDPLEFSKPDPSQVTTTNTSHPRAQCRLDTYFAADLCTATFDIAKIPGRNNPSGQFSLDAEKDIVTTSCTTAGKYTDGLRPRCWFKAGL